MGCIGTMFVFEHDGVIFDILMLLKTLGVGLLFVAVMIIDAIE